MNDRVDRFHKRRADIAANKSVLTLLPSQDQVARLLAMPVDQAFVEQTQAVNRINFEDYRPTDAEALALMQDVLKNYNNKRFDGMLYKCKMDVLRSTLTAFKLGAFFAAYDKTGGNVDTIHNVRKKIYATDTERNAQAEQPDYTKEVHAQTVKDKAFVKAVDQAKVDKAEGTLADYMTGLNISEEQTSRQDSQHIDHIVSVKEIYDDPGRILAGKTVAELANDPANLAATVGSLNMSKKDKSVDDFNAYLKAKAHSNEQIAERSRAKQQGYKRKIEELDNIENKTPEESAELSRIQDSLEKQVQVEARLKHQKTQDSELASKADENARDAKESKINDYYFEEKFLKNLGKTSVSSGFNMGKQQLFGAMLADFLAGLFDEVMDWHTYGRSHEKMMPELTERFLRVQVRTLGDWKERLGTFLDGSVSGFFSGLITSLLNIIVTTSARVVRLIREGIFVLFRAIKMLIVRPKGMTRNEAYDAASKALLGGSIIVGGIALEQVIEGYCTAIPVIGGIAHIVTPIVIGGLTAVVTLIAVNLLDKADFFDVNRINGLKNINKTFDQNIANSLERIQLVLA